MEVGPEDKLISVREAAKECDRNPETIRRWIWSGKLPAEKLGNQLFVKRSTLKNFCIGIMGINQDEESGDAGAVEVSKPALPVNNQPGSRKEIFGKIQTLHEQIRARSGQLDIDKYIGQLRGDV